MIEDNMVLIVAMSLLTFLASLNIIYNGQDGLVLSGVGAAIVSVVLKKDLITQKLSGS
jgi:hypothetical protein